MSLFGLGFGLGLGFRDAAPFSPANIPGLIVWYDPADALTSTGVTPANNGVVASLPSHGGSWGHTLDEVVGTVRYLATGGPGGGPCLANDGIAGIRVEGLSETPGNDFTIVTASYKVPGQTSQYWQWAMAGSAVGGTEELSLYMDNGEAMNFRASNGSVSPDMGSADPDGSWRLYSGYVQSSSVTDSSIIRRGFPAVDGSLLTQGTYTIGTIERFCYGGRTVQGVDGCRMGPVLIYNRVLTTDELNQVTEWFNQTYFDWRSKAELLVVADASNLTLSGTDVTAWSADIGGPLVMPSSAPTYSTANFSGKGQVTAGVHVAADTFGSLAPSWGALACRISNVNNNRPGIGGGSQFAMSVSDGDMSMFDGGGYKLSASAAVSVNTDVVLEWHVNAAATSVRVFVDGVEGTAITIDGNVGSDNLPITLGAYNAAAGGVYQIRAAAFGLTELTDDERLALYDFMAGQL